MKTGIILANIGSPRSPKKSDVAKYLRKFLMDPLVIEMPVVPRWLLVNLVIAPFRAGKSAANYQKIWTSEGSPLMIHSQEFASKLQRKLGTAYQVEIAMNFCEPTFEQAIQKLLRGECDRILLCPMYPQYAEVTTGGTIQLVQGILKKNSVHLPLEILPPFYYSNAFIGSQARIAQETPGFKDAEHVLFSFHGLPEKQILRDSHCKLCDQCCSSPSSEKRNCYRAQCFKTASLLAEEMKLKPGTWTVSFQSRLGRAEWIKPYTEDVVQELTRKGIKKLAVVCPAFVADCLETLEEIGMGLQEKFKQGGGETFIVAPCVNSEADWVDGFSKLVAR